MKVPGGGAGGAYTLETVADPKVLTRDEFGNIRDKGSSLSIFPPQKSISSLQSNFVLAEPNSLSWEEEPGCETRPQARVVSDSGAAQWR